MVPCMRCMNFLRRTVGAVGLGVLWGCASAPPNGTEAPVPPVVDARPQAAPVSVSVPPLASSTPAPDMPRAASTSPPAPTERELLQRPDAEPRVEPVRPGGPNKPYQAGGESYAPQLGDMQVHEKGIASWYGRPFHGRKTASGEVYDMYAMTAAHKTLPIPSYVRVRNPANGREVIVRINDRGPFIAGRIIDLSYAAAVKLGTARGVAPVELERITHDDILAGRWRRDAAATTVADAGTAPALPAVPSPVRPAAPSRSRPASAAPAAPVAAFGAVTTAVTSATVDAQPLPAAEAPVTVATGPTAPAATPAAASSPNATGATMATEPGAPANAAPSRPQPAFTVAARGFWLQLGAFAHGDGAANFRRRVEQQAHWLAPLLAVFNDAGLHRLQAGPYPSRKDAHGAADRLRQALSVSPLVLERR
jgi:rare lipoprotein A